MLNRNLCFRAFGVFALLLGLTGCASEPLLKVPERFEMPISPAASSRLVAVIDRRAQSAQGQPLRDGRVVIDDTSFAIKPATYVQNALQVALEQVENPVRVVKWLNGKPIELTALSTVLFSDASTPPPTNPARHAALAVLNPFAPLIGIGIEKLTSNFNQRTIASIEIEVFVNGKVVSAYYQTPLGAKEPSTIFMDPAYWAVKTLARRIELAAEAAEAAP
jgi:hypothetical protein